MRTYYIYRRCILILASLFLAVPIISQAPFSRGVNLTSWFQVNSPGQIQFTKFTKKDVENIKSLGCDVIRLPINMHGMTSGSPSYTLDPLYFSFLDSVVTWCEKLKIYLILDNHSYDPAGDTQPGIVTILVKVWSQMAQHYKDRSDYILYEILNEPHGMSTTDWGAIQGQVITAIRAHDTKHTIVVGGSGWNTYTELKNLPVYTDLKLLYTFHFYDPFMFTHQGASWTTPSMEPLSGVPFPYNSSEMPGCPPSLVGTWIESNLNSYPSNGNVAYIKQLIDNAISFRTSRNVNIFCGEFGAYMKYADNDDRCFYYKVVKDYLQEKNIPWTIWDYKGGFGVFNKGSNQMFEHDLNTKLLDSLGLDIPVQTPFSLKPDSTGFLIYTDYIGAGIEDVSYGSGTIDYYSDNLPSNDGRCLYWKGFSQYNTIGFDFVPDKDLSRLVSENYALDFMVRGSDAGIKFEIRFLDTKTEVAGDHPWRMGTTIDESDAQWDRKWHHVNIPLSEFTERGAWDVNTWYNPEGKYDWTKVDKLEVSTEYTEIIGKKLWFDNIHITNLDTAIVRVPEALGINDYNDYGKLEIKIAPNPMHEYTRISFPVLKETWISINIFSAAGVKVRTLINNICYPGYLLFTWDGHDNNGLAVKPGIYLCQILIPGYSGASKIIKY